MKKINTGLLTILSTMSFLVSSEAVQNLFPSDHSSSVNNNENTNPYREAYLLEKKIEDNKQQLKEITKELNDIDKTAQEMIRVLKISEELDKDFIPLVEAEMESHWKEGSYPTGRYIFTFPSTAEVIKDREKYNSYLEQLIQQRNLILQAILGQENIYTGPLQVQQERVKLGKIIVTTVENLQSVTNQLNKIIHDNPVVKNMIQTVKLNNELDKDFDSLVEAEMESHWKEGSYLTGRYIFTMPLSYIDKDDLEKYNHRLSQLLKQRQEILEAITE